MSGSDGAARPESILLVGNYRPTLVVARALSKAGYRVVVGRDYFGEARLSRYVDEVWRPRSHPMRTQAYVKELAGFLHTRPDITAVLPLSQTVIVKLLPHAEAIPRPLITATPEAVMTSVDKVLTSKLAAEAEVPVPRFAAGSSVEELIPLANEVGYPCIAKKNGGLEYALKALVLRSEREARHAAQQLPGWFDDYMVQQFAWGVRYNRYFLAHRGSILRFVDVKTFRSDRIDGTGLGVSGISTAPLRSLDGPCERLVARLGYSGAGNIQFLVDEASGAIAFLELNPMIGGNHGLAYYCGLDQANGLLDVVRERNLERWRGDAGYPAGKRYAWLQGDLEGLARGLDYGEVSGTQAVRWAAQAVVSGLRADCHLIWAWDDPLPALRIFVRRLIPFGLRVVRRSAGIAFRRLRSLAGGAAPRAG